MHRNQDTDSRGDEASPFLVIFRHPNGRTTDKTNCMRKTEEIKDIVQQLLEGSELFLVEAQLSPKNEITVFIDSPTGVDVATCIRISKQLEEKLNRETEDFELTVSSAGIGYPFKVAGQYLKNLGKQVEVKTTDGSRFTGILRQYDGEKIVLEYEEKIQVEGKKKKETIKKQRDIALSDIKQIKDLI